MTTIAIPFFLARVVLPLRMLGFVGYVPVAMYCDAIKIYSRPRPETLACTSVHL